LEDWPGIFAAFVSMTKVASRVFHSSLCLIYKEKEGVAFAFQKAFCDTLLYV